MNSAIEFTIADFPGYAEFVALENEVRGLACLGINETICGLEVKPLCAAHVRLLSLVGSPFLGSYPVKALVEKPGIANDVMLFLWIVSPHYEQGSQVSPPRRWWQSKAKPTARDRFNEAFAPVVKMDAGKVIGDILLYVENSYIDAEESAKNTKSYFAFDVAIAHELCDSYPTCYRVDFWNPECPKDKNPLQVPLKIVFQLRKLRAVTEGQEPTNKSEKLIQSGLGQIGKRQVKPETN